MYNLRRNPSTDATLYLACRAKIQNTTVDRPHSRNAVQSVMRSATDCTRKYAIRGKENKLKQVGDQENVRLVGGPQFLPFRLRKGAIFS